MKNVVVTGGAGFIGSHLCEYLLKKGFRVVCLDNLITGSEKNIEHLKEDKNFKFENIDVSKDWTKEVDVDYIYHLASPASPIDYQNFPEETALVNSVGTIGILERAKDYGAKFLLASTSEIYGDPEVHPQKENYFGNVNTVGPRSCYDESKRFAETMTYVYNNKYGVDTRIVRIFNTYGPKMQKDDGRVISNFVNQALQGDSLFIDGDGSQTRSFCYVTDMVEGLFKAMFSENTSGEVFNLGNPDEYKIKDLAEKIIKLTDSDSEIVYSGKFRRDDPMRRQPDITKAKSILEWTPEVNVDEGLKKTIEYYKNL